MDVAHFQNPIANMPLVQQLQLGQESATQQNPIMTAQHTDEETNQKLTTVQESPEGEEGDHVREDEENGGQNANQRGSRSRTQSGHEEDEKKRASDGIHGNLVDIQA